MTFDQSLERDEVSSEDSWVEHFWYTVSPVDKFQSGSKPRVFEEKQVDQHY